MNHHSSEKDTLSGHSSSASKSSTSKATASPSKQTDETKGVLFLKQNHVRFNAPSKIVESVFFDECNREIISLTSGIVEQTSSGETRHRTRALFQSTDQNDRGKIELMLPVEKRLLSIKLNSSRTVLAYHVERNIIEFMNVRESLDSEGQPKYVFDEKRYVQNSRAKNSKLIGFLWTGPMDLVIITDLSVEYYHVDANRHRLKHIKLFQSATNWFVYQPPVASDRTESLDGFFGNQYSILMVSTGSLGNSMQPYMFSHNQIMRLQRFEVEGSWHDNEKLELFERSITIAHIYGRVRLLVLQHESLNVKSKGAQIVLYTVDPESGVTSKTHTLDLDVSGRFAINIFDNLVIAHNQPTKSSFIFDIMIESTEKSDCPKHFVSLIDSQPIRQLKLDEQTSGKAVEMYSLNWVFFQPNFIVDARLGLLSTLQLDLFSMQDAMQDNFLLLTFLAHRRNSEEIILEKCKQIVADSYAMATDPNRTNASPLADVSSALEILGKLVISAPELEPRKVQFDPLKRPRFSDPVVPVKPLEYNFGASLYQEDIQREVFRPLETSSNEQPAHFHFISSTLLEFILVVRRQERNVEFCIYEQLLKCLMNGKRYYQIIQMIRSEIFKDSKQLACLLLSMRSQYRPAGQLGLDMFHRLDCLTDLVEAIDLNSDSTRSSIQMDQSIKIDAR